MTHAIERTLSELRERIERDPEAALDLAGHAAALGVSTTMLSRRFQDRVGVSPSAYRKAQRMQRLRRALRASGDSTQAIFDAGFGAASRVYGESLHLLGMTPRDYARGGAGVEVCYTLVDASIGRLLIAATPRGICAVMPGSDDDALVARLADELPKATLLRVDEGANEWFGAVLAGVERALGRGNGRSPDAVPIDVDASAFQLQVWQALTRIPPGVTMSYQQLAESLGRPRAVRAVARACASNRLAIIVPATGSSAPTARSAAIAGACR
jgi:AraC family transcriptional regulator of adaptative response/methylated-DNA-[protein]-cysteine methyltransferase